MADQLPDVHVTLADAARILRIPQSDDAQLVADGRLPVIERQIIERVVRLADVERINRNKPPRTRRTRIAASQAGDRLYMLHAGEAGEVVIGDVDCEERSISAAL